MKFTPYSAVYGKRTLAKGLTLLMCGPRRGQLTPRLSTEPLLPPQKHSNNSWPSAICTSPSHLNNEYTEYTICLRCKVINKIDVGNAHGISHEFHERGACLLMHSNWLVGRYETYEAADHALRLKLKRLAKRREKKCRDTIGALSLTPIRDRGTAESDQYPGPERRRSRSVQPVQRVQA